MHIVNRIFVLVCLVGIIIAALGQNLFLLVESGFIAIILLLQDIAELIKELKEENDKSKLNIWKY